MLQPEEQAPSYGHEYGEPNYSKMNQLFWGPIIAVILLLLLGALSWFGLFKPLMSRLT